MTLEQQIEQDIEIALREDVGTGCISSAILPTNNIITSQVIAREAFMLCGQAWFSQAFYALDEHCELIWHYQDGQTVEQGAVLVDIKAHAKATLVAERTALNFLQLLSGTATVTAQFVEKLQGTNCRLLDTRKTIPGLRCAQKYATAIGGAVNHRIGLYDAFLIKENHITAFGSVQKAIMAAKSHKQSAFIEVEVETLLQLKEVLALEVDRIMLDNFDLDRLKEAVLLSQGYDIPLEASGNVSIETIQEIGLTGVDYISVGAITKHVKAVDMSLLVD